MYQHYRQPTYAIVDRAGSPYRRQSSPYRSQSPVRMISAAEEQAIAQAAQAAAEHHSYSFSLYEQHRVQREERERAEYERIQGEHQRSYEINQFSQGNRDRIIATYRAEIESHKLNDRDFC